MRVALPSIYTLLTCHSLNIAHRHNDDGDNDDDGGDENDISNNDNNANDKNTLK